MGDKKDGDQPSDRDDAKPGTTPATGPGEGVDPKDGEENGGKKRN